jgi:hypothetical protein
MEITVDCRIQLRLLSYIESYFFYQRNFLLTVLALRFKCDTKTSIKITQKCIKTIKAMIFLIENFVIVFIALEN